MWFGGSMMVIDIEGTDGSGKKTQTDLLYDKLVSLGKKFMIARLVHLLKCI